MSGGSQVLLAYINPRISRKQVQEKAQIYGGLRERVSEAPIDGVLAAQFFSAFIAMFCAIIPVAIIGTRFAMSIDPFKTPQQFSEPQHPLKLPDGLTKVAVPVVGMLSGNSISSIVVSIDYVLKEFV